MASFLNGFLRGRRRVNALTGIEQGFINQRLVIVLIDLPLNPHHAVIERIANYRPKRLCADRVALVRPQAPFF
ncbi:MAG: hypothetical protein GC136_11255 [Alphaproteobacteria bacterium]|nr:hypothetical protein [Alphaproteobacteria bacterium]